MISLLSTSACLRYAINRAFKPLHSCSYQMTLRQSTAERDVQTMTREPAQTARQSKCNHMRVHMSTCTTSSSSSSSSIVMVCLSRMASIALPLEKLLTFQNIALQSCRLESMHGVLHAMAWLLLYSFPQEGTVVSPCFIRCVLTAADAWS